MKRKKEIEAYFNYQIDVQIKMKHREFQNNLCKYLRSADCIK